MTFSIMSRAESFLCQSVRGNLDNILSSSKKLKSKNMNIFPPPDEDFIHWDFTQK